MAEYIDKEKIERVRLEDSCYIIEHFKGDEIDCIIDAPTEDVIEREKIDNALADMQLMLDQEVLGDNVISDVGQGIAIAMGLLRTNIGE